MQLDMFAAMQAPRERKLVATPHGVAWLEYAEGVMVAGTRVTGTEAQCRIVDDLQSRLASGAYPRWHVLQRQAA